MEIFGPVVNIYSYDNLEETIEIANDTSVSFQASIFSNDIDETMSFYKKINASAVFHNDHTAFRVDWMPFAGLKHSGHGVGGIKYTMHEMQIEKNDGFKKLILKGEVMKASDLFIKCLEEEGVTKIFGIPGEENADFMISLKKSTKIEFILCRHEQAAAFMADVYGRLTGKAGVCLATLGPGVTNLVTGLADANMDRAPVVAQLGKVQQKDFKESHQIVDSISMVAPISKWVQTILSPKNITEVVRKAFKVAETEKPRVTVIELPEDIAKEEINDEPIKPTLTRRPAADNRAINEAVELITNANNPIILAGNGTIRKRASNRLRVLVENLGIGVINTFMGKGSISSNDKHSLFTIGLGSGDYNNLAIDESDLVIAIGYDLVEYSPSAWNRIGKGKKKSFT